MSFFLNLPTKAPIPLRIGCHYLGADSPVLPCAAAALMGKCPRHQFCSCRGRTSTEPSGKKLRKQGAISIQGSPLKLCSALLSPLILPSHPLTLPALLSPSWCPADSRTPVFTHSDSWKGAALWWHDVLGDGWLQPESVPVQGCGPSAASPLTVRQESKQRQEKVGDKKLT